MGILPEDFKNNLIREIMKGQIPIVCKSCCSTLYYNPVKRKEENKWTIDCPFCHAEVYCPESENDYLDYLSHAMDTDNQLFFRYRFNEKRIKETKETLVKLLIENESIKGHLMMRFHGKPPEIPELEDIPPN